VGSYRNWLLAPQIFSPIIFFSKKIQAVVKGETKPDKTIKITHIISGGAPTKRIDSKVEILGNGEVTYTINDESKKEQYTAMLDERTVKNLLKDINLKVCLTLRMLKGDFCLIQR
jgi:hypothetical protein